LVVQIFIAPIVIGLLALAGAVPAAARSKPEGTSVGAATTHDPAAERNSYTLRAHREMDLWEQKLLIWGIAMNALVS
jgi:hypothetical protein